ncbi:glycine cleavage system protein T [candidate division WOR-3 bacterium JGI_Cruoil_03_51_56]|uniref:Aminomethyltransferase n=1 Tax=candidate division WOR-3 bacterium JGI_Cruoil_03_51_56 TaxID=1973747 RepID=A0A235BQG5_UNCW3|nr:MAG: glycine cleavage system protein T [candidate division WOR-3 bacterium JGI_Cruoil_03_51_56]
MLKITPFHDKHLAAHGRMVEFAGYDMPIQFRGIIPEHNRVRTTVGVFDVSHMGRIKIHGKNASSFINHMTTNDVAALKINQAQYSVLCYPDAGIVDDLVVYRLKDYYFLVVNGSNNEKDTAWLKAHLFPDTEIENVTEEMAQLAIQGPKAELVMQRICSIDLSQIGFYWAQTTSIAGIDALISRTGYTGEDGFELYFPVEHSSMLWDTVMDTGKEYEIEPIGLGARDTLRMEMKYCLYGNDIDKTTNPLEAGLSFVTKLDKPDGFIGSDVLKKVKQEKPSRRLVCLELEKHAIARPHYKIYNRDEEIGHITSGTISPSLGHGIALGYVKREQSKSGTELAIDIRGRRSKAVIVKPPFYKHGSRK